MKVKLTVGAASLTAARNELATKVNEARAKLNDAQKNLTTLMEQQGILNRLTSGTEVEYDINTGLFSPLNFSLSQNTLLGRYFFSSRSGESNGHEVRLWRLSDGTLATMDNCPAGKFGKRCWAAIEVVAGGKISASLVPFPGPNFGKAVYDDGEYTDPPLVLAAK